MIAARHVLLVAVLVIAGCGGEHARRPAPKAAPPAQAGVLLTFQRQGGSVATLDVLTVRRDGSAELDKRYGGAGRRREPFRLTPRTWQRLRRQLRQLPRRPRPRHRRPGRGFMLLHYRGEDHVGAPGAVPRHLRALFFTLDAVIDGEGRTSEPRSGGAGGDLQAARLNRRPSPRRRLRRGSSQSAGMTGRAAPASARQLT